MSDPDPILKDQKTNIKSRTGKQKEVILTNTVAKEKRKRSKQDEGPGSPVVEDSAKDNGEEVYPIHKKEKKKKKKSRTHDDQREEVVTPMKVSKGSDKRKRGEENDVAEPEVNVQRKKRSKKAREGSPQGETNSGGEQHELSVGKKKKKGVKSSLGINAKLQPDEAPQNQRKKRKNKTGYPDPENDTDEVGLAEQAKKALSYAFTQFHEPDQWKFQKARQNWLIRNFWNPNSIPEKYEDLVIKYLSAVQGNARDNLITTCRTIINETPSYEAPNAQESTDQINLGGALIDADSPLEPVGTDKKKGRALALLRVLAPDSNS